LNGTAGRAGLYRLGEKLAGTVILRSSGGPEPREGKTSHCLEIIRAGFFAQFTLSGRAGFFAQFTLSGRARFFAALCRTSMNCSLKFSGLVKADARPF
jgi:hypothetical protein